MVRGQTQFRVGYTPEVQLPFLIGWFKGTTRFIIIQKEPPFFYMVASRLPGLFCPPLNITIKPTLEFVSPILQNVEKKKGLLHRIRKENFPHKYDQTGT